MPFRLTLVCALVVVTLQALLSPCIAEADTFKQYKKWFPVGPNPSALVAPDLNGDGIPEIVTTDIGRLMDPRDERPANEEVSVLSAEEVLKYVKQVPLRTGFGPYCIAVANIDALPAPDLVVGCFHAVGRRNVTKHMTLFRNIGDMLFEPLHFSVPTDFLPYTQKRDGEGKPIFTTPAITSLVVRDFNQDGYRDVVATGWASDVLVFFPGHPERYFEGPRFVKAPGGPRDVQAADLDDDGHTDLVTTMYNTGEVALWKGDGAGGFAEVDRFKSRGSLPHKVRVGDINGDGVKDIIVSHCHAHDSVVIFYGDGEFGFSCSQEILLGETRTALEHEIRDILVEDLNGDTRTDIAVACSASSRVFLLMNVSEDDSLRTTFSRERYVFKDDKEKAPKPRALCTADFNGDGQVDVGVALWDANAVALLLAKPTKK
jgi:VCBS repeat protein